MITFSHDNYKSKMEMPSHLITRKIMFENPPPNIICSAEKSPWSGMSPWITATTLIFEMELIKAKATQVTRRGQGTILGSILMSINRKQ